MSINAKYSISDLSHYTGIKPHTIRIWEKRYNLLAPKRSCTNIRGYDGCQLRKLLNINTLLHSGWKISRISQLSEVEMDAEVRMVMDRSEGSSKIDFLINGLMVHMLNFDEQRFSQVFTQAVEQYGLKNSIVEIVYPFLKKIGVLWQIDDISPAQEHFASAILRRKILSEIDRMPQADHSKNRIVLCLPPDEFHELPLLLAHYILLEKGVNTVYLGSSVPPEMAAETAKQTKSGFLFTLFMSGAPAEKIRGYLETIHENAPDLKIYFSGSPETCKKSGPNDRIFSLEGIEAFERFAASLQ
jgi:DNA-binding transcriptional MerR regulator